MFTETLVKDAIKSAKRSSGNRCTETAESIAIELIKNIKINEYPVPIVSILNNLGFNIYVSNMPSPNISGFIYISPELREKHGTDRVIAVSENDSAERQRFTLAHELGHFIFDYDESSNADYFDTYDMIKKDKKRENVPSRFAAELLMPTSLFADRFQQLKENNYNASELILQLSRDFCVNTKAVLKRCHEISNYPYYKEMVKYVGQA